MIELSSNKDLWESQYLKKGEVWRGRSELPFDIKKGRVLELGCGNGKTVSALMSAGIEPICLDISRNALVECAKTVGPSPFPFVEGDMTSLPFADDAFDSIICFHVLEHLTEEERRDAMNEIERTLKKDGKLYVQSFSVNDMRYGKGTKIEEDTFERGDGIRYHYFHDGELETLFGGFAPVTIKHKVIEKRYRGQTMYRDVVQIEFLKR